MSRCFSLTSSAVVTGLAFEVKDPSRASTAGVRGKKMMVEEGGGGQVAGSLDRSVA